jgi:hypothetical protein
MPTGYYKRTSFHRRKQRDALLKRLKHGEKFGFQKGHKDLVPKNSRKKTLEWRKRMSEIQKKNGVIPPKKFGKNHPNWKGGITPLTKNIRHCFKYRQWISDVFTRDDFTCQDCNIKGGFLHAHHIKQFSIILKENSIKTLEEALNCEELWNINNGITLCKKCHKNYKVKK